METRELLLMLVLVKVRLMFIKTFAMMTKNNIGIIIRYQREAIRIKTILNSKYPRLKSNLKLRTSQNIPMEQ